MLLATVAILSIGAAGSVAAQDTLNVSENAAIGSSDTNCDSRTVDHTDIQDAVDAASAGTEIVVCPGEYKESVTVDKQVRIVAANPETTVDTERSVLRDADGNGTAFTVQADDVSIEGFSIENYSSAGIRAGGTATDVSGLNVNRSAVRSNGIGIAVAADGVTVSDTTLEDIALSSNDEGLRFAGANAGTVSTVRADKIGVNTSTSNGVEFVADGGTVTGVSLNGSLVNDTTGVGVRGVANNGGEISDVTLERFVARNNTQGVAFSADATSTVSGVQMNETVVDDSGQRGVIFSANGGTVTDIDISRLVVNESNAGVSLNGTGGIISDTRIEESDIGSTEGNGGAGIQIVDGSATNYDNVTVSKSLIRNNNHGVLVDDTVSGDLQRADVNVSYNLITDNGVGVQNNNTGTVFDARLNYWGDSSGPSSDATQALQDPVYDTLADGDGDSVSEGQDNESNVRFAGAIGGKRDCSNDEQLFDPAGATGQSFETTVENETIGGPVTDYVGLCLWERSVLPLRGSSATAAQSLLNIPTFIDSDSGQVPINRQDLNVYERGREVNVTFERTTGANTTSRYANEDAQVHIVRTNGQGIDENTSVEDLFSVDFDALSGDARFGTDRVEFVAVKNVTLNEDGALPEGVQFTPNQSGTYVALVTVNQVGEGLTLDENDNLTGNIHRNDITFAGIEAIAVRETESTAEPDRESVTAGENVTFQLDAEFAGSNTDFVHTILLYNEDNFTQSQLVLATNGSFDAENLTFDNGTLNATLTAQDGTKERVTIEVDGPADALANNITVAGEFSTIDSVSEAGQSGRTATTRINTTGLDNGTYRFVHTAVAEDGRFSTTDGTIGVGVLTIPQAVDADNDGLINTTEIITAIDDFWRTGEPVPGTGGKVIPTNDRPDRTGILTLIDEFWRTEAEVTY